MANPKFTALCRLLTQARRWSTVGSRARHSVDRGSSLAARDAAKSHAATAAKQADAVWERAVAVNDSALDDRLQLGPDVFEQIRWTVAASHVWVAEIAGLYSTVTAATPTVSSDGTS